MGVSRDGRGTEASDSVFLIHSRPTCLSWPSHLELNALTLPITDSLFAVTVKGRIPLQDGQNNNNNFIIKYIFYITYK